MRKTVLLCCITGFSSLLLTSCSANHSKDVYFIHAASFVRENDGIAIYAAAQKTDKNDEGKYFVASSDGKTVKDAVKKLSDKYSECYFATNEILIFKKDDISDEEFLDGLSYICENPFVPCVSRVAITEREDVTKIIESIENEDDLKKLLKETEKSKLAFVSFLGTALSESQTEKVPVLSVGKDGKVKADDTITVGKGLLFEKGKGERK